MGRFWNCCLKKFMLVKRSTIEWIRIAISNYTESCKTKVISYNTKKRRKCERRNWSNENEIKFDKWAFEATAQLDPEL